MHDSAVQEDAAEYLPKTRHGEILDELIPWSQQPNTRFSTMCFLGPKSNLAHLVTARVPESHLAASFFFPSVEGGPQANSRSERRLFPTIAWQLAIHFPPYKALLETKLCRDPGLVDKALRLQFRELIVQPFEELIAQGDTIGQRRLIIVEGLEECKSSHARREIPRILMTETKTLPFRWAVFICPDEVDIDSEIRELGVRVVKQSGARYLVIVVTKGVGQIQAVGGDCEGGAAVVWLAYTPGTKIAAAISLFFFNP
ncbi:hypothetical protein AN958_01060 [Leucoagaricus sp. SymC.cos]|nr:hypothetical protein AN958_01060 [Leucoagaricus sp. SymC.cos]